jgi:hypothetical protein
MYENAKSTIEDRGRSILSIKWRKGVKQGWPRSPRLCNFCLERLLQAIRRNKKIQSEYVRTKEELLVKIAVQTETGDMIFVSESEDGVIQMLQILDLFME